MRAGTRQATGSYQWTKRVIVVAHLLSGLPWTPPPYPHESAPSEPHCPGQGQGRGPADGPPHAGAPPPSSLCRSLGPALDMQ